MFHVLEIRKNLVFASLLSTKGFKIVLEFDMVIVTKTGMFVGNGYSYCHNLFLDFPLKFTFFLSK
jgi:hypothetical protein